MRNRIYPALAAVAIAGGLGLGAAQLASADSTATTTSTAASATTASATTTTATAVSLRGYCIKVGTGDFKNLWLDANGKCPVYSAKDAYWGPVSFGGSGSAGPQGPKGDKGDKGDAGDSVAKVVAKAVTLNSSSPASQTVVLAGLPAKSSAVVELPINNAGEAPSGTTVTVTAVTPASGSTERSFTVTTSGFTASQTFVLNIKVLAVAA